MLRKKIKILDAVLIAVVLAGSAFYLYLQFDINRAYTKEEIDGFFNPVTTKYGIRIVYDIGQDFFSPIENPPIPAGPHRDSEVKPIRHRVLLRYPALLKKAFEKYPRNVIQDHLSAIYFSKEIDHDGLRYGGTYDPFRKILYIVDSGKQKDIDAIYAIHHELSSLLLSRHSFYVNPWVGHNPEDSKYLFESDNSVNVLEIYKNIDLKGTEDDYEKGFVTDYGHTSFENDFNEYSAMIFTYPQKFKKIMDQHARIRGKFLVWLEFYQKVDPIFTEDYLFNSSDLNASRPEGNSEQ